MKKRIICGILIAVLTMSSLSAFAEETPSESSSSQIVFRNIPWFTTKSEADKIFEEDGATIRSAAYPNDILRMSGINHINVTDGKDRVEGGGIIGRYSGLNVAGYDVSDTYAAYIYTLNDDGSINKSDEDAEFYFGWYTFDSNDFVDGEGIYNDLYEKLVSLYGDGQIDTESSDYFSNVTWHDNEDNQIRLQLGAKGQDNDYVTLGYMVAGADELLDEMQVALDAEAAAQEAQDRENNADNVSGL